MTLNEYLAYNTPRLKDYPASAPCYDEINKPVSMPKPSCVSSSDENKILRAKLEGNGYFDDTRPDSNQPTKDPAQGQESGVLDKLATTTK